MTVVAIVVGVILVVAVLADILNTLVATTTSTWRWCTYDAQLEFLIDVFHTRRGF